MANWYVGSTKYSAVTQWQALTTYSVGNIVRQLASPAVGSERCFRASAITTGISGAAEPSWTLTKNATTTDSGVTWTECTGQAAYNGDGGGSAWAAPMARLNLAISSSPFTAAGDTVYVSNNHAETRSSGATYTGYSNSNTTPVNVICVSDAASPPTATATTATVSTTGASNIQISGSLYLYGITFSAGGWGK